MGKPFDFHVLDAKRIWLGLGPDYFSDPDKIMVT
jgi:hypothetical protein